MSQQKFDPAQHLTSIKGQEYLEVKWRLAWLRSEHPDAVLSTQLVTHDGDRAIFSAQVSLPDGGSATGWGSETAMSFGNYIEKAETKAIGRALAALGFGTQFCQDFDDGPETGVLADAPVQFSRPRQQPEQRRMANDAMTAAQKGKIQGMSNRLGIVGPAVDELARSVTGAGLDDLTKTQASRLIDTLVEREKQSPQQLAS